MIPLKFISRSFIFKQNQSIPLPIELIVFGCYCGLIICSCGSDCGGRSVVNKYYSMEFNQMYCHIMNLSTCYLLDS